MVVVGWPFAEANAYKADHEANYLKTLELAPEFADRVRGATREDRFTAGVVPNFFRKPFGPGWALVGDAGYTKDPITAQGITDAFHDAELCATALRRDVQRDAVRSSDAMSDYQQTRDARGAADVRVHHPAGNARAAAARARSSSSAPCTATRRPWTRS